MQKAAWKADYRARLFVSAKPEIYCTSQTKIIILPQPAAKPEGEHEGKADDDLVTCASPA